MKKQLLSLLIILITLSNYAQIIPAPESLELKNGYFELNDEVGIIFNGVKKSESTKLTDYIINKIELETSILITSEKSSNKNIVLEILKKENKNLGNEGYLLSISENEINITANGYVGVFYGAQSLLQYVISNNTRTPIKMPALIISDKPNVAWRGMTMDVSRHFYNTKAIKELLDLMAFYKLNVFQWHLADNEGWRLEIKKYPKLTDVGAWRTEIPGSIMYKKDSTYSKKLDGKPYQYGGFYTQKQVKEIVAYAKDRNITVVPEIDVPGHSGAALSAYPEFSCEKHIQETPNSTLWNDVVNPLDVNLNYCAGQDSTFAFLENVFTEVMDLFPSTYIHIGGDEVDKSYWKKCPVCQKRMADNNLKNEEELQSYFLKRIAKFLEKNNRKVIGWDEILDGGAPENATVMSWRGEDGGIAAAKLKQDVIMSPSDPLYFNRYQDDPKNEPFAAAFSINTLQRVYDYQLIPEELSADEAKYIIGSQFAVWTEFISSVEHLEYILLPRLPAFAENLWSNPKNKNYSNFVERLNMMHFDYWKENGIRFHSKLYTKSAY
tara:strand:+ start:14277 stop:15929 length:1653 start_codon:yes stop_codon:yes gene_type:complete